MAKATKVKQKLYLTLYKDGKPMPSGFVCSHMSSLKEETELRLDLALYALESVGYEAMFETEKPVGNMTADEYEEC